MEYATGAPAPNGIRWALVREGCPDRTVLEYGQRKALQTDRVVLIPGPDPEIEVVRTVFAWFVDEELGYRAIARRLTCSGVAGPPPHYQWTPLLIKSVLSNRKYIGMLEFNRTRATLSTPRRANPPEVWICKASATPVIVEDGYFTAAHYRIEGNSMTKAVSSTAAMVLIEQDKIDADTPVQEVLPEFADIQMLEKRRDHQ